MTRFALLDVQVLPCLLLLLKQVQDCHAFISPLAAEDAASMFSSSTSSSRSLTPGSGSDPYELHYRAYYQSHGSDASSDLLVLDAVTVDDETTNKNNPTDLLILDAPSDQEITSDHIRKNYKPFAEPQWIQHRGAPNVQRLEVIHHQGESEFANNRIATTAEEYYNLYQSNFGKPVIETIAEDVLTESVQSLSTSQQSPAQKSFPASDFNNDGNAIPPPAADISNNVANGMTSTTGVLESLEEEMTPEQTQEMEDKMLNMINNEFAYKQFLGQNPYALTDLPFDVIIGRILDGWEDNYMSDRNKKATLEDLGPDRPTVVVLGSGWGSHSFVKHVSMLDVRVIVVSPVNHFVFTPMLASAAVGTVGEFLFWICVLLSVVRGCKTMN